MILASALCRAVVSGRSLPGQAGVSVRPPRNRLTLTASGAYLSLRTYETVN